MDSIVDACLCCRTPGLSPDYVCLFFIFKIVFPPEGLTCIFLGLSEAGFLLLLPTGCTGSEPSAVPCLLPPDPPAYSSRLMDISVALPYCVAHSDHPSPTSLQFPLIFYRAWIEKDKYGVYPGVLSSLSRSGCPELSPPPPRPQQPWAPGVVFPTPVHSTRSRPLHRPGCMLGCRCHLAGNLPGSSSPESPRLDTVAAPPPDTHVSLYNESKDPNQGHQFYSFQCSASTAITSCLTHKHF